MVISHSYVNLPEGNVGNHLLNPPDIAPSAEPMPCTPNAPDIVSATVNALLGADEPPRGCSKKEELSLFCMGYIMDLCGFIWTYSDLYGIYMEFIWL